MNINELMEKRGLVDILKLDSTIKSDIRYATENNFVGKVLYSTPFNVYAESKLANAVVNANRDLIAIKPGCSIIIFDAARPLSIQKEMFEVVKGTSNEKYVANPYEETPGGFHNYGMAVDLSIIDENGNLLDMGTDFDSFSELAHVGNELELLSEGRLSNAAYTNRMLLYYIMGKNGLLPYKYEWWHYQFTQCTKDMQSEHLLDF